MQSSFRNHPVVRSLLVLLFVASAQLAVGQKTTKNTNEASESNTNVIDELLRQLEDAHQRELDAVVEAHKLELQAATAAHTRELDVTTAAHTRELSAAAAALKISRDQIDVLKQENVRLNKQAQQLRDEVDRWKSLASPNYLTFLARIRERSEELSEKNRDEGYDISDLERRRRQAQLAMTQVKNQLLARENELSRYRQEYKQHWDLARKMRSISRGDISYEFNGTSYPLPKGENTSQRMDDLRKRVQSITKEVQDGTSAYARREFEFKRLDQALSSRKEEQLRRRKQRELLEETYDQALMDANAPRN